MSEVVIKSETTLRDKLRLIAEEWSVVDTGFSSTSGKQLASVVDWYGRTVAVNVLKEDAEFIALAVNKAFEVPRA